MEQIGCPLCAARNFPRPKTLTLIERLESLGCKVTFDLTTHDGAINVECPEETIDQVKTLLHNKELVGV